MARRLLCCPYTINSDEVRWRYLYLDTSKLLVKDVTKELTVFEKNPQIKCCYDTLLEYYNGTKTITDAQKSALSFNLFELNSLELFKTTKELELKTGSAKILSSCLLSYYRREYDGSQQYAFFSNPSVSNLFVSIHDGVEHELTLETREFVHKDEEQIELETLDKGKTEAQIEEEEKIAQAQAEFEKAMAEAEKTEKKAEKNALRNKRRKFAADAERYREIRNQDDVNTDEYRNIRLYEEEMRSNNDELIARFKEENYSALPGVVSVDTFSSDYEKVTNETTMIPVEDENLYKLSSKLDEFGVPYTVKGVTLNDGTHISEVYYTSDYGHSGSQAAEFFELERQLELEGVITPTSYYSAYQLSALEYACVNYVSTDLIASGDFNSRQMYRMVEAGLNGQDMSVLANPLYSPAQMDALSYFMYNNWDTAPIASPGLALDAVAGEILREELSHGTPKSLSFFETYDYNSFIAYNTDNNFGNYSNDYDSAYRKEQTAKELARQDSLKEEYREFKANLHDSYEAVQRERNYIAGDNTPVDVRNDAGLQDFQDYANSVAGVSTVGDGSLNSKGTDLSQINRAGDSNSRFGGSPVSDKSSVVNQNSGTNNQGKTPVTRTPAGAHEPTGMHQHVFRPGANNSTPSNSTPGSTGAPNTSSAPTKPGTHNTGDNHQSTLAGNPNNTAKPYSFNAGYSPAGRTKSNGEYVANDNIGRRNRAGFSSGASLDGALPKGNPKGDQVNNRRNYPLNDLKVRSNFAKTAGLKLVNGGSQAVGMSTRFFKSSMRQAFNKMARNDETGTYSAYNTVTRGIGTTIYTARLITDVPRLVGIAGQGASRASNAVANAGRIAIGKETVTKTYQPMTFRATTKELKRVQEQQFNSIRKKYGDTAAKMSTKEIDANLKKLTDKKSIAEKNRIITENRKIKSEILSLDSAKKMQTDKNRLIGENKKLKNEIKTLSKKTNRTAAEDALLSSKLQRKAANEKLIAQNSVQTFQKQKNKLIGQNQKLKDEIRTLSYKKNKTARDQNALTVKINKKKANEKRIAQTSAKIKKFNKPDAKTQGKIDKLSKRKKDNEKLLKKRESKIKQLKDLKKLKKANAKELAGLGQQRKNLGKKGARWKQLPGRLAQSFVSQLYKAGGDITMEGIATASNFAMSFARNPIVRITWKGAKFVGYGVPKKAVKYAAKKFIVPSKPYQAVKKTTLRHKAQFKKTRRKAAQKAKAGLKKRVVKTIGVGRAAVITRVAQKFAALYAKANPKFKFAAKIVSAPFKALKALSHALSAAKAWLLKAALYVGAVVLVLVLVITSVSVCFQGITSFLMAGETSPDGRIDLTSYVQQINGYQDKLQNEINDIASGKKANGKPYDNIFYDYNGLSDNNTNQILSMAYVRFDYEWDENRSDVNDYMEQLYKDSNYVDYGVSAPYYCTTGTTDPTDTPKISKGCEEREYKCYDKVDQYATTTRKNKHKASDHSKEDGVVQDKAKGCDKSEPIKQFYYCDDKLEYFETYTKEHADRYKKYAARHGCVEKTKWETKTTYCSGCGFILDAYGNPVYGCPGHEEKYAVTYYDCPGHYENLYTYSCPGHKETICRGEHQDLTITVTTLGFDEIFAADSSVAAEGANIKGEAFKGTYTITGYCPCHECCHWKNKDGSWNCGGKDSKKCKKLVANPVTRSETTPKANHTIAVDPDVIPLGTHVWIDGKEYVAEDTGGAIKGNRIDMYFNTHQQALNWGVRNKTIYKNVKVDDDNLSGDKYGFTGWTPDNIEICKNVYSSLIDEKADEDYKGLDEITSFSYGSGGSIDFDFSGIIFDDKTGLTNLQKDLLKNIERNTIPTQKGHCQAWVSNVYAATTGIDESRCCAIHAGVEWGVSDDWSDIQVGAAVYGYNGGGNVYGHVGIYIGEGKVAHNIGYVQIDTLEYWVKRYDARCWGWNGAQNLTGKKKYDVTKPGKYMVGRH